METPKKRKSMPKMQKINDYIDLDNKSINDNKKRPAMKKPILRKEKETTNDFDKVMQNDIESWVQQTFLNKDIIPEFSNSMNVKSLACLFRQAYFESRNQPKYTLQEVKKGSIWDIKTTDNVIETPQKFYPSCKSSKIQQRLFTMAMYSGVRLLMVPLFAALLRVYAMRNKLFYLNKKNEKIEIDSNIRISSTKIGIWSNCTIPSVIVNNKSYKIDTNSDIHLTVWIPCKNTSYVEIDICDMDILIREHDQLPDVSIDAMLYLSQNRMSAIQQNATDKMDSIFPPLTKQLRFLNKKIKQKERKKRKKTKRKKKIINKWETASK